MHKIFSVLTVSAFLSIISCCDGLLYCTLSLKDETEGTGERSVTKSGSDVSSPRSLSHDEMDQYFSCVAASVLLIMNSRRWG